MCRHLALSFLTSALMPAGKAAKAHDISILFVSFGLPLSKEPGT
jgi:hypothetical protein